MATASHAASAEDSPEQEARQAALRRQQYETNQRAIANAFAALQKRAPAGPQLVAQLGHGRAVNSLSLSADGRLLLTGSDDRTARLWDARSGLALRAFLGQQSSITAVALSPDGKLAATGGGDDRTVRVWDAATGSERLKLSGPSATIGALAFFEGGKQLASIDWDDTLRLWDLSTGKEARKFEKSLHGLSAIFSPDGKTLISSDAADNVTLLDVATGAIRKRLAIKEASPVFACSNDATLVAIGGRECDAKAEDCHAQVWLWDAPSDTLRKLAPGGDGLIRALALSPDKQQLAVSIGVGPFNQCDGKCALLLRDLTSGNRELWRTAKISADVKQLAFSPDGKSLIAAGNDGSAYTLEAATGRTLSPLGGDVASVAAIVFSPDGKWLAVGSGNPVDLNRPAQLLHVMLWDLTTGRIARRLALFGVAVSTLNFSADARWLAAGSRGDPESCAKCGARLWEVATGRETQSFATDVRRGGFALSPDGRSAAGSASGSDDYTIGLWDAASGKLRHRVESGEQWAFAFSPDGSLLASVGGAGDITLRDGKDGSPRRTLENAHADMRPCVAFSPDGKRIAAGATSLFSSAVWDVQSGKVTALFDGHSRDVTDIRISNAGLVATASLDTTTLLWAARGGRLQRVLAGHLGGVTAVAFAPGDKLIATGSIDGTTRLWDVATGRQLAQIIAASDGEWTVLSEGGHFDSSKPERSGCHFVSGDRLLPAEQAQKRFQSALEPGLLRRLLRALSR